MAYMYRFIPAPNLTDYREVEHENLRDLRLILAESELIASDEAQQCPTAYKIPAAANVFVYSVKPKDEDILIGYIVRMEPIVVLPPGEAKIYDFMACCLLLAKKHIARVERREITVEDLNSPFTYVIKQGKTHRPDLKNFHYQVDDPSIPVKSSLNLLLQYLEIDLFAAHLAWPWLEHMELLESKGSFMVNIYYKISAAVRHKMESPVQAYVLKQFEKETRMYSDNQLRMFMELLGTEELVAVQKLINRFALYEQEAVFSEIKGLQCLNLTTIPAEDVPLCLVEPWVKQYYPKADITIIQHTTQPDYYTLYKSSRSPRVAFSRLCGLQEVVYICYSGLSVSVKKDADIDKLLEAAIILEQEMEQNDENGSTCM